MTTGNRKYVKLSRPLAPKSPFRGLVRGIQSIVDYAQSPPPILIIWLLISCLATISKAEYTPEQTRESIELSFVFRQAATKIDVSYCNNKANLDSFINKVEDLYRDPRQKISRIEITAYASPEGYLKQNNRLSHDRVENIVTYLKERLPFLPDSVFLRHAGGINWHGLERLVENSDMKYRDEVLVILRNEPEQTVRDGVSRQTRLNSLKRLDAGRPYRYMYRHFFPLLRNGKSDMQVSDNRPQLRAVPPATLSVTPTADMVVIPSRLDTLPHPVSALPWVRHAYVKTNLPAWLCFWTNVAGEIDIAPHWSANLAIYYSGFDYFKHTQKFRTFAVMPEFRYWPLGRNDGFFVGAHAGMVYYNIALQGDYRYQDRRGRTPALGGGATLGYRFALPRNPRWKFEASVGYGIYKLDYDIFENRHNGPLVDRRKRTFYGVDNVAFSVCYTFDINKKSK